MPPYFFGTGQSKHVVILVDGSAYGAKAVVTVGQHIRDREFLKSGCSCCLDDTYECNIMGSQFVKLNLQASPYCRMYYGSLRYHMPSSAWLLLPL